MADFNSALPVRTSAEDVASADGDYGVGALAVRKATPANTSGSDGDYEFLQISAGRLWTSTLVTDIVPGVTASSLGKAEGSVQASGDVGVSALFRADSAPAAITGVASGDYSNAAVDLNGRVWICGSVLDGGAFTAGSNKVVAIGAERHDAVDVLADAKVGMLRCDLNRSLFVGIRDAAGNDRGLNVDSSGRIAVTGSLAVADAAVSGDVCDYGTASSLAAAAATTTELQYTVVSSFLLKQIIASASGRIKVEVKVGPTAALVTVAVGFNSTAHPIVDMRFGQNIEVLSTSTGIVRIVVTNLESASMDVYGSILGIEV